MRVFLAALLLGGCGGVEERSTGPDLPPEEVAPAPLVEPEPAAAEAPKADARTVKATVRRYSGQMKYCYEKQLKANPGLEGSVELGWTIEAGAVTGAYVAANNTGDEELAKCMLQKLKRWKFPPEVEGAVQWPFMFRPN